jgi:integrase/recombinase XerD
MHLVFGVLKTCARGYKKTSTAMTILAAFRTYIEQIGYSKTSQYQIPYCVNEFLRQVAEPNIKKINQHHILDFYEYLQTRPLKRKPGILSEAMIQHYVFSLKTFFSWLEQTEQLTTNPISNIRFKRAEINPREPLSQQEIKALFAACKTAKEIAILHLFYSCGLRRTEAVSLTINDIHFSKNLLYVREGKGAKRRVIPITEKVKRELEHYFLTERIKLKNAKDQDAFIVNSTNERMRGDSYNSILKQLLQKAGITKPVSLHHLRHSIATHLLENGLSLEFVRDFLGHSHLETTQLYTRVSISLVKSVVREHR